MSTREDLSDKRFGKLKILEFDYESGCSRSKWKYICDCGKIGSAFASSLKAGRSMSCGKCLYGNNPRKIINSEGKEVNSPTYNTWISMRRRCTEVNNKAYAAYGESGITVCSRWINSFENFYEDMGERPEGMTLDRIDGTKGYFPENCRWATYTLQAINTKKKCTNSSGRTGVYIETNGKYSAQLRYKSKMHWLGIFNTFEAACAARESAELKFFGYIKK